ncbi:MAG: ABC-2 transporter permease [Lachnospiraceae bacterium]|nr:ABC-2 transporter permease [Lachnospiraceae bacterium]
MKGLLVKDFNLLKSRGIFFLVFIVGYTIFQIGTFDGAWAVGFATLMIGVFSLTTITYDEYENGMPFLFTLPIRRIDYVREKYVFGFLVTTVTWVIVGAACFLFDTLIWPNESGNFLDKLSFYVAYLIGIYFIISLQIALHLKFVERSSVVMMALAGCIGVFALIVYAKAEGGASFTQLDLNWTAIIAVGAIVLFALMFVFYRWSVRIMEKREF